MQCFYCTRIINIYQVQLESELFFWEFGYIGKKYIMQNRYWWILSVLGNILNNIKWILLAKTVSQNYNALRYWISRESEKYPVRYYQKYKLCYASVKWVFFETEVFTVELSSIKVEDLECDTNINLSGLFLSPKFHDFRSNKIQVMNF